MQSQSRLVFTLAFLSCGFLFAQPASPQIPVLATASAEGEADPDETEAHEGSGARSSGDSHVRRITADGMSSPDPESDVSTALVASYEMDRLLIEGTEVNPVEYPALPEVQGTRINSGKKTSFVKPEEFPSIANNDYRELLATTPGLLVSEEPSSPIVNFGYRGLDS